MDASKVVTPRQWLQRFERAIEREEDAEAERALEQLRARAHDSWERSRAEIGWRLIQEDLEEAELRRSLEDHVERWPDDADVRHQLGSLLLDSGLREKAIRHWEAVRALDATADDEAGVGGAEDVAFVIEVAQATIERMPRAFRKRLEHVPVLVEERPSADLVASGFDPRAYGLFEGPNDAEVNAIEAPAQPSRIVLYLHNLCADFASDEELRAQVQITVLHEVGHYFGLEEDDMPRLGLE